METNTLLILITSIILSVWAIGRGGNKIAVTVGVLWVLGLLVYYFGSENTIGWVLRRDYEVIPGTGVEFPPCIVFPLIMGCLLLRPVCYIVGGVLALWALGLVIKFAWNSLADKISSPDPTTVWIVSAAIVFAVFIFLRGILVRRSNKDWA